MIGFLWKRENLSVHLHNPSSSYKLGQYLYNNKNNFLNLASNKLFLIRISIEDAARNNKSTQNINTTFFYFHCNFKQKINKKIKDIDFLNKTFINKCSFVKFIIDITRNIIIIVIRSSQVKSRFTKGIKFLILKPPVILTYECITRI